MQWETIKTFQYESYGKVSTKRFKIKNELDAQFSLNWKISIPFPGIKLVNLEVKERKKKSFEFLGITIGEEKSLSLVLSWYQRSNKSFSIRNDSIDVEKKSKKKKKEEETRLHNRGWPNRYLKDIGRIGCVRRQISRNVQQFVLFAKLHDVQRSSLCCVPKEFCNKDKKIVRDPVCQGRPIISDNLVTRVV